MGYADEILQIRQQRAQRDIVEAQEAIKERYAEMVQARDQAAAQGDAETFELYDREAEQLRSPNGNKFPRHRRRKRPCFPSQARDLSTSGKPSIRGTATKATEAYKAAHKFAVERGLKPDTVEYFKYCDDALDMYAKDYGMRYDPSEKVPHPNEVCAFSGLTYDQYNAQHRKMYAEGRDSNSQAKAQWSSRLVNLCLA